MIISLGFVRSSSQALIRELDWQNNTIDSKLIDVTDLPDQNLQGLFIDDHEHLNSIISILEKEKSHYPIINAQDEKINFTHFEDLEFTELKNLDLKVLNRWTMHHNLNSLENMWTLANHMRDLWKKDRITFFEELWYWLKRNLGASDMTIIFNDVINTVIQDENNEKKDRPKLIQSMITGSKKANFHQGGAKEKELMQTYLDKFHDIFEITEFNPARGQFVATAQIEKSPMIIMARVPQLNQIQRTTLTALFKSLQF